MSALDDVSVIVFDGMGGDLHHKTDPRCHRETYPCRDCGARSTDWHIHGYYLCTPCAATWCALTMIQYPKYTITKRK